MKRTWFLTTSAVLFLLLGVNSALALETETKKNSVVTNMGLYGGQPEDIAVEYGTDNVYIALFSSGGLYYSNDAAENWHTMKFSNNDGVAKSVEVDQSTGDVYAVIGDDLLKSTDNGASTTKLTENVPTANFGWGMTYGSGRLLVATNDGGVIVSTDGGATFSAATIESGSNIVSIAASPTNNTFYATAEDDNDNDNLYESTDGGSTWTDMQVYSHGVTNGGRFYRVGVDPLDSSHIVITSIVTGNPNYQTFNGGTSWTALEANGQEVSSGYVDWDGQGRMFTSQFYTADASATPIVWTELSRTTPLSSLYFDQLTVDRGNPLVIYTNTGLGLAKSIDRGANWTDNVEGIEAVKTYAISQAKDKDVLWIGANGGLARSLNFKDAEPTWEYPILPADTSNWKGVWVKPANADYVVAAAGTSIYYTENGTATTPTWTQATTPTFSGGGVMQIVSRPGHGNTLYAAVYNDDLGGTDSGAVWQSTDAGQTWTNLSIPNDVPAKCLSVAENGAVYVGLTGDVSKLGVYKYSAKGTWSRPSADLNDYFLTSILVDQENNDVIYATTENGFYTSEDKGATWIKTNKGLKEVSNLST
ncbi:hypothetical protein KKF29_02705, partial [Patescibacteria group bacterium]|nr:hypothetical protein [Patescibacteria group bacterium]